MRVIKGAGRVGRIKGLHDQSGKVALMELGGQRVGKERAHGN